MQACDVGEGILSAAKATSADNQVVFDADVSYIEDKIYRDKTWAHEQGVMRVFDTYVRRSF